MTTNQNPKAAKAKSTKTKLQPAARPTLDGTSASVRVGNRIVYFDRREQQLYGAFQRILAAKGFSREAVGELIITTSAGGDLARLAEQTITVAFRSADGSPPKYETVTAEEVQSFLSTLKRRLEPAADEE